MVTPPNSVERSPESNTQRSEWTTESTVGNKVQSVTEDNEQATTTSTTSTTTSTTTTYSSSSSSEEPKPSVRERASSQRSNKRSNASLDRRLQVQALIDSPVSNEFRGEEKSQNFINDLVVLPPIDPFPPAGFTIGTSQRVPISSSGNGQQVSVSDLPVEYISASPYPNPTNLNLNRLVYAKRLIH